MRATVLRGSRNIFTLRTTEGEELECRIKGKVLKGVEGFYNPLAPGDRVLVEKDPASGKGLITGLEERRNLFTRMNQKGQDGGASGSGGRGGQDRGGASQLLAANVDLVLCVTAPASPPWRPRFLDRLILQADIAGIEPLILCNKWEIAIDPDIDERLEDYRRIGYEVLRVSVHTGWGIDALRERLRGKLSVLAGQSGVGKSSLINALLGHDRLRVGALNEKYDRGNHTTSMSALLEFPDGAGGGLIDTPGIRRLLPDGVTGADLALYMREFAPLTGTCSFGLSCSHKTEPGCKILEAVAAGVIHEDRYESFLRLKDELSG
ncbi:MAG: ribosome small subunit-dependent GTPase A [Treponema sp.]|nr:ribosome small subunit-dependent GTPase A [Treponema sp.]